MTADPIQLEDDLILRSSTITDEDQVVELNRIVHGNPAKNELAEDVGHWTRDLFAGSNRDISPADFTVVEDTSTKKIVSTICLMSQV